jgi:hypothetical protein
MFGKTLKIVLAASVTAVMLAGCQSGMRGSQVFAGFNGDPHCAPGPKPCPREYPEFPLPPGGPYLETPGYVNQGPGPHSAAPARLNLNSGSEKLTVAK